MRLTLRVDDQLPATVPPEIPCRAGAKRFRPCSGGLSPALSAAVRGRARSGRADGAEGLRNVISRQPTGVLFRLHHAPQVVGIAGLPKRRGGRKDKSEQGERETAPRADAP